MILEVLDKILGAFGAKTKTVYMSAEFGLPPGALYREELAQYSDAELMSRDAGEILDEIRAAYASCEGAPIRTSKVG